MYKADVSLPFQMYGALSGVHYLQYAEYHIPPQECLQSLTNCYEGITTCFWAKIPDRDVVLINTMKEYERNGGFTVYIDNYRPHWLVVLDKDLYMVEVDYLLSPETWYHFCLKGGRFGNSKEAYLLINGQKLTENFVIVNLREMPDTTYYVGSGIMPKGLGKYFSGFGTLDELLIFNYFMKDEEIMKLYLHQPHCKEY